MKTTVNLDEETRRDVWRLCKAMESEKGDGRAVTFSKLTGLALRFYAEQPENAARIERHRAAFPADD